MQIQGDYHPHSGQGYEPAHTHHITKCLHEEEQAKKQTGAAGIRNRALSSNVPEEQRSIDGFYEYGSGVLRQTGKGSGKPGFIRELWDSLGDEKEKGTEAKGFEANNAGISAISAAIRQFVSTAVAVRIWNVREKISTGIGTAFKRFGKREDTFGSLSNPGNYFEGKRRGKEELSEKAGKGTRRANQEIITATFSDSHLMDSYSKTGRYCRLNENLIYQKKEEESREENHG